MRLPVRDPSVGLGFNMTPMIDVVFLLIIFFLVSSHLARRENQLELPLPLAATGQEISDDQTRRLTLNVLDDGELLLAGRTVLPHQLAEELLQRGRSEPADLELRIRASRHVAYGAVSPILLDAARAGIWNVHFAVFDEE